MRPPLPLPPFPDKAPPFARSVPAFPANTPQVMKMPPPEPLPPFPPDCAALAEIRGAIADLDKRYDNMEARFGK